MELQNGTKVNLTIGSQATVIKELGRGGQGVSPACGSDKEDVHQLHALPQCMPGGCHPCSLCLQGWRKRPDGHAPRAALPYTGALADRWLRLGALHTER